MVADRAATPRDVACDVARGELCGVFVRADGRHRRHHADGLKPGMMTHVTGLGAVG